MKFGMRKPSIKRSLKAKTTGKSKRQVKKVINPAQPMVKKVWGGPGPLKRLRITKFTRKPLLVGKVYLNES